MEYVPGRIGARAGLATSGVIDLQVSGGVTISEDIVASGQITISTSETAGTDNITFSNGADVQSLLSNVALTAADDLNVGTSTIEAKADVRLGSGNNLFVPTTATLTAGDEIVLFGSDSTARDITVAGTLDAGTSVSILGGSGTDRLIVPVVVGFDPGVTAWEITGANSGDVSDRYAFSAIENLRGGAQKDRFIFNPSATISGEVDGATGMDTLDYSRFSTAVTVNFTTNANHSNGTVINAENITGGAGNDTLTRNTSTQRSFCKD